MPTKEQQEEIQRLTVPGYDAIALELLQDVALQHYEQSRSRLRDRRIVDATCETCETFSFDDSSDLYGAIYVYVRNWLEGVIAPE
jgi:hypothetical protein